MNFKNKEKRNKHIRMLWALARELGYDSDILHVIVDSMTGKKHISQLTIADIHKVNNRFLQEIKNKKKGYYKMRLKIFALCHKLDWEKNNKIDTKRLNGLIFRISKKKNIYSCTGKDLQKIIIALESLIKWENKHENYSS